MDGLLHGALEATARRLPDRVALRSTDRDWTYRDLGREMTATGTHLRAHGVGTGDRVAIMASNRPEVLTAVLGVAEVGAVAVLLSPAWRTTEVAHAVELTGPVLGIADDTSVATLAPALGADRVLDLDDPATAAALAATGPAPVHGGTTPPSAGDDAVLVFSSGTTGLPKAVRHTHATLGAATDHWVRSLGLTGDDRFQVATPPSHILGLLNLLAAVRVGATVRLHRRFDIDAVLAAVEADRITLEMAVAPIALALADHPDLERYDLSSLRYIMWGATPVTASVADTVTRRTGVRWLPAYGASEVPVLACNPVDRPDAWRLDRAGLAPDDVELRVVDLADGTVLGPDQIGEIQARGPSVMAGYLPEADTAAAFDDGWFRTGDVGRLDADGWVELTDRAKEMIKVNGFQVAPAEIEAVLHGHPDVADCAVFGVDDERAGEVPVAAVALADRATVTADELRAVVVDRLAAYKQLRAVVLVEEIPRLPSGKVLRRRLRDELAPGFAAVGEDR